MKTSHTERTCGTGSRGVFGSLYQFFFRWKASCNNRYINNNNK